MISADSALAHWRQRAETAEAEVQRLQAEREALMRRFGLLDAIPVERASFDGALIADQAPDGSEVMRSPTVAEMAVFGIDEDEGSVGDTVFASPEVVAQIEARRTGT